METTHIRKGRKEDLASVLELIRELATFEKAPLEVTNTLAALEEDGFGPNPLYSFLVSYHDHTITGMALYYTKYSTWKGKGIYLEDIIIKESYRNKGIGKKLFSEVIKEAKKFGAKQLHWQVLDWNSTAIEFYKKYRAEFDQEWINCKMNEAQINSYIV